MSLLSLAEDKKLHDSEFAEELFDATLKSLPNHKLTFKENQLQTFGSANNAQQKPPPSSSLPTEVMSPSNLREKTKFEIEQELLESQKNKFDIKKYKNKPFNLTYASGMYKSNPQASKATQAAMNVYVTVNHHYNNNKELKGSALKDNGT